MTALESRIALRPRLAARADLLHLVEASGAILHDHFVLQGGLHAEHFLRFSRIGLDPPRVDACARALVDTCPFPLAGTTVICPESAGFYLGHAVARALGAPLAVSRVDRARRPTADYRQGAIAPGAPVVIVNDVVTTGHSLRPLAELARQAQSPILGVLGFATQPASGARLSGLQRAAAHFLVETHWPLYAADECPLCRAGITPLPAAELN
jgi:orotate phosphoribosyltransferase